MRKLLACPALVLVCLLPALASEPGEPPTNEVAPVSEHPTPRGCTDEGKLVDGMCSKGQPVYLPDGQAIGHLRTRTTVQPSWPEETNEAIKASMNLQIVVLPDGNVTEILPTFLRVTLPGEEEQRMDPSEDKYRFVKAATDAVAQWRYEPLTFDGRPVAVYGSVCLEFSAAAAEQGKNGDK